MKRLLATALIIASLGLPVGKASAALSDCHSWWIYISGYPRRAASICYGGTSGSQRIKVDCGGGLYAIGPWVGHDITSTSSTCPILGYTKTIQFA